MLIAVASEDHFIDISLIESQPGELTFDEGRQKYINKISNGESEHGPEFSILTNKYLLNRRNTSSVMKIETGLPTFSVAWHPRAGVLAYACDERSDRSSKENKDGTVRIFGI